MTYLTDGRVYKSSSPQNMLDSISRYTTVQRLIQTKVSLPYLIPLVICLILQQWNRRLTQVMDAMALLTDHYHHAF